MKKQINAIAVLLMFLVSMMPAVIAADTNDDFEITKVEIDDFDVVDFETEKTIGPVYAGEQLKIEVSWKGKDNISETEAKIRVGLADIEEETDFFTVRAGWEDSETLVLNLDPDIFDIEDESENERVYRLHIEMEDEDGNTLDIENIKLRVVNQRHLVEVYDINFPNGREVKAGEIFQVNVGVKNRGHSTEEDVGVKVSIPELGLSTRSDKFDLYTENEFLSDDFDDDDFPFKLYRTLFIPVPLNTVSGVYDVVVEVEYDDGDKINKETTSVTISSGVAPSDAVISIADTSEEIAQGKGAVYKLMFANLGNQAGTYTVEVTGVSGWGAARVDPQAITIGPDETREVFIFVSADENADLGEQSFQAKVKAGNTVVKTFDLKANVVGSASPSGILDVKDGLQVGFLILLVILVILGIILLAKRLGKDGKEEEPFIEEDQTYY